MTGCFCFANPFGSLFFPSQKGTICSSDARGCYRMYGGNERGPNYSILSSTRVEIQVNKLEMGVQILKLFQGVDFILLIETWHFPSQHLPHVERFDSFVNALPSSLIDLNVSLR